MGPWPSLKHTGHYLKHRYLQAINCMHIMRQILSWYKVAELHILPRVYIIQGCIYLNACTNWVYVHIYVQVGNQLVMNMHKYLTGQVTMAQIPKGNQVPKYLGGFRPMCTGYAYAKVHAHLTQKTDTSIFQILSKYMERNYAFLMIVLPSQQIS